MIRRGYLIFAVGLGAAIAATVLAGPVAKHALRRPGVYTFESSPIGKTPTSERGQVFDSAANGPQPGESK